MWKTLPTMLVLLSLAPGPAQAGEPAGLEFQVNAYTSGNQNRPQVAVGPGGEFVVVWHSYGSPGDDTSGASIQAQRYEAGGSAAGDQFQVNTYTTSLQRFPEVAFTADGGFLVVWDGVAGQRYAADGSPVGGEMSLGAGFHPALAVNPAGEFVVVWEDLDADPSYGDVSGQRFASDGSPVGGTFQVNTYTTGFQPRPEVALASSGEFLVTWFSEGSTGDDSSGFSIQARRFDSSGSLGDEFQVNTVTAGGQYYPAVDVDSGGDFLVVWSGGGGIRGQKILSDGAFSGAEFQVESSLAGAQYRPAVTGGAGAGFVVAWESTRSGGTDASSYSVQARTIDAGGIPEGDQFQVNTYTTGEQRSAAVAMNGGQLVVVWRSDGSAGDDQDGSSIQGQRYSISIFADGFESGDVTAWSSAVP